MILSRIAIRFTGPNNKLAHAFYPDMELDGDIHFNDHHEWTGDKRQANNYNTIDLYSVAAHEIGHSLGLRHSDDKDSIMFKSHKPNDPVQLDREDIKSIRHLYGEDWSRMILAAPSPATTPPASVSGTTLELVTILEPLTTSDPQITKRHVCHRKRPATRRRGCRARPTEQPQVPQEEDDNGCTSPGKIPDPNDCQKFYRCIPDDEGGFHKIPKSCRARWVFNRQYSACDWPHNVKDC